jgi:glutamate synthase (ferredoxin)
MMMVVPEAWEKTPNCLTIKSILRIQCLYYGALGWPASIPFTDGNVIGALSIEMASDVTLYLTKSGFVYVIRNGVLDIKPEDVVQRSTRTWKNVSS